MTQQVLQETLQMWLDGMTALHLDILAMDDLPTPSSAKQESNTTSTLLLLEGENTSLAQLWNLTKQLEATALVLSWEQVVMQVVSQEYRSLVAVVLAVSSEQWSFLQETDMSEEDE